MKKTLIEIEKKLSDPNINSEDLHDMTCALKKVVDELQDQLEEFLADTKKGKE